MDRRLPLILIAATVLLAGCNVKSSNPPPTPPPSSTFQADFTLASTDLRLPFPNDLYFNGSTDGTVNIPGIPNPTDYADPLVAINTLDGFSSSAPITETFTSPIDPATLPGNVYVFSVTTDPTQGYVVTGVQGMLKEGTDYTLSVSSADPSVLEITPTTTLGPNNSFMVVVTDGVKGTDGQAAAPSPEFKEIKQDIAGGTTPSNPLLAGVEPLFGAMLQAAQGAAAITPAQVAMIWTFSTQSEGDILQTIAQNEKPGTIAFQDTGQTTKAFNSQLPGYAEVYVGKLSIPYYSGIPTATNPSPPLTQFWHGANGSFLTRYNRTPVPTAATLEIPVIMTIPAPGSPYFQAGGTYPANGWKVAIFQHGITRDRVDDLAVADTFAEFGIATIAIDLPLHGVTDTTNPFYQNQLVAKINPSMVVGERTFNLPKGLLTGTPQPGTIASSGSYFIDLAYPLTDRDNLREAVADLLRLTETLPQAQFTASTGGGTTQTEKFNALDTYYSSISLGAIVGIPYLAEVPNIPGYGTAPGDTIDVRSATLSEPGGKVAYLLENSPTFGPEIQQGLATQGLTPGTLAYQRYFQWTQTVVDSGDPINYAAQAAKNVPIDMTEVLGDQVITNTYEDMLIKEMGLTQYSSTAVNTNGIRGVVRFTSGSHGSLLDPTSDPTVTQQMQIEMGVFAAGCLPGAVPNCPTTGGPPNGQTLVISYPSVVQ